MPHPGLRIGAPLEVGPFRIRRIDYPPGLRQPEHSHAAFSMTVLLAGDIYETTRTGEALGSALSVVVKPAGVRHANEVGPRGARTVQVAFLPEVAEELTDGAGLGGWRWQHGGPACAPLLGLAGALRWGATRASRIQDRILDAVAALSAGRPADSVAPGWIERVKEALDDDAVWTRALAALVARNSRIQSGIVVLMVFAATALARGMLS